MKNLANEVLRYYWALLFTSEDRRWDENFVSNEVERLSIEIHEAYTKQEKDALADAARDWLATFMAEPDEYGYTPRKLLTTKQRAFLEEIAACKV